MENFKDGVILLSVKGDIAFVDRAALAILELSPESVGQSLVTLLPLEPVQQLLDALQNGASEATREFGMTSSSQKNKTISLTLESYQLSARQKGLLLIVRDLSALRRLETMEKDFITNVSHELRTPLTSIKMAAESLHLGAIGDPKMKERFLSNIQREADRLTRLVNELIILSNVQEAKTNLHLARFHSIDLFEDVISTMEHHSQVNDIELVADYPAQLPDILADRDRLNQVLINLVDNAIKCNRPQGKVTLFARHEAREQRLCIKISDTGIGIPKIDLPRIFERFFRVDKARSRVTGGTGLGLSIVKDLIEAHGGHIEVDSELNVGTTFTIYLPLVATPPAHALDS